jgi:hypothetical protein
MKKLLFYVLLSLILSNAQAIEPLSCRNGFFPKTQNALQLATVNIANGEKLHFYNDDEGCPKSPQCKNKAYLVAQDTVIINAVTEGWACAWFQGKKRETVGWLNVEKLQFQTANTDVQWTGKWKSYDNTIEIKNSNGKIQVVGAAFWTGAIVAGEPVIHTGNINGELVTTGNHATVSEGDDEFSCHAEFTLLGHYLIVADNNNCGGANVSFNGFYTKAAKQTP